MSLAKYVSIESLEDNLNLKENLLYWLPWVKKLFDDLVPRMLYILLGWWASKLGGSS